MGADSLLIVSHETHNVDSTLSQRFNVESAFCVKWASLSVTSFNDTVSYKKFSFFFSPGKKAQI